MGVIIGLPALRVKGLYLALVTIAQAAVFPTLVNIDELGIAARTGGPNGKGVSEEVIAPGFLECLPGVVGARGGSAYRYWIIVLMLGITLLLITNYLRSRPGRAVLAIRDNEAGAAVYGVNLPVAKTMNFAISASLGSLAGLMWCLDKAIRWKRRHRSCMLPAQHVARIREGKQTPWILSSIPLGISFGTPMR